MELAPKGKHTIQYNTRWRLYLIVSNNPKLHTYLHILKTVTIQNNTTTIQNYTQPPKLDPARFAPKALFYIININKQSFLGTSAQTKHTIQYKPMQYNTR